MTGTIIERSDRLDRDAWKALDVRGDVVACGAAHGPTLETGDARPVAKIICGADAFDDLRRVSERKATSW